MSRILVRGASVLATAFAVLLTMSCAKQANRTETENRVADSSLGEASSILQPAPSERDSLASQLIRFETQTKYLGARYNYKNMPMASRAAPGGGAESVAYFGGGTAKREIEESDVFKIEDKLVYLLNDYRGLQVVSFDDLSKPKIVARIPASGNSPKDMFYNKSTHRLYVLENFYFDQDDGYFSTRGSRLMVYDATIPDKPKTIQVLNITGEMEHTQRVGDVIYVATAEYGYEYWRNPESSITGHIHALKLDDKKVVMEDTQAFSYPLRQAWNGESINIIEAPTSDPKKFKYYALATLGKTPWGWGGRQNIVEVFDITDPKGKIKPLMFASARGSVGEKSQMFIKNDTLIVVSNYTGKAGLLRVAVETFRFPDVSKEDKYISQKQSEIRQLTVDDAVGEIADAETKAGKEEAMLAAGDTRLRGVFVRVAKADKTVRLQKLVSDYAPNTTGSDEGLNAAIQDVRMLGNKLFVFWVPQSYIDPLEIFDISNPEKGVTYVGQTKFKGWAERSYPVAFQGKEYIIALGKEIPANNNEFNKRYAQAMVFEVPEDLKDRDGEAKRVAALRLDSKTDSDMASGWINFNGADKEIPLLPGSKPGKFMVLFKYQSYWGSSRGSGAKIIDIDLNPKKPELKARTAFVDGGDWLTRVFENHNLKVIHTFSPKTLTAFGNDDFRAILNLKGKVELARDIRDYVVMGDRGVQIISDFSSHGNDTVSHTILRLVDPMKADAEEPQALATETLDMPYQAHLVARDGSLYLLGQKYNYKTEKDEKTGNDIYKSWYDYTVTRVVTDQRKLAVSGTVKWNPGDDKEEAEKVAEDDEGMGMGMAMPMGMRGRFMPRFRYYSLPSLVELPDGTIAVNAGTRIRLVNVAGGGLRATKLNTKECSKDHAIQLRMLSGKLVVTYTENLKEEEVKSLSNEFSYFRNFLALAKVSDGKLECKKGVNIPGTPVAILGDNQLVTQDQLWIPEVRKKETAEEVKVNATRGIRRWFGGYYGKSILLSASLDTGEKALATLASSYDPSLVSVDAIKQVGNKFVFIDKESENDYRTIFSVLSLDSKLQLRKNPSFLNLTLKPETKVEEEESSPEFLPDGRRIFRTWRPSRDLQFRPDSLIAVYDDSAKNGKGAYLAIAVKGRTAVVLGFNEKKPEPEIKSLVRIDENYEKSKPTDHVTLLNSWRYLYYYGGSSVKPSFDPARRSIVFPQGLYGNEQIIVQD